MTLFQTLMLSQVASGSKTSLNRQEEHGATATPWTETRRSEKSMDETSGNILSPSSNRANKGDTKSKRSTLASGLQDKNVLAADQVPTMRSEVSFASFITEDQSFSSEESLSENLEICNNLCLSLCSLYCLCWVTPLSLFAVTASSLSCIMFYSGQKRGAHITGRIACVLASFSLIVGSTYFVIFIVDIIKTALQDPSTNMTNANGTEYNTTYSDDMRQTFFSGP